MEFYRDKDDQIYGNHCFRLGKVLEQYERCVKDEERYEVTLLISILQSIAVYCSEYMERMAKNPEIPVFASQIDECGWGLKGSIMKSTLTSEEHTLKNYINHIRNAVSHPNKTDPNSETPATGFTTSGASGSIEEIIFIDSEDVKIAKKDNKPKILSYSDHKGLSGKDMVQSKINGDPYIPDDVTPGEKGPGKYIMYRNGMPYIRMTKIKLSTSQLRIFIYSLLNVLSQPKDLNWDYKTPKDYFKPAA